MSREQLATEPCHFCHIRQRVAVYELAHSDAVHIDTGMGIAAFDHDGIWDACAECSEHIDARDFTSLATRVKAALDGVGARFRPGWSLEALVRKYELIFAYRSTKRDA
ncbi:hypothetical protein ACFYY2_07620 [Streptomyces sp. NPDC001822]|uniref:hypothetical protein n=1 Tax=Streptomyces sp. NPDC001822 TaxID=3364614 RepID=UPI0036B78C98